MLVGAGADVNKGVGPDTPTPICVAVQSGNRDMVDYLLQRGVTDVRKALAVAREKNMDDIIGMHMYMCMYIPCIHCRGPHVHVHV